MQFTAADSPHGLVGESPQICQIRQQIEKLRGSSAPVLVLGESGTGKEVVARALHGAGNRGSFIPIDCGSLVGPLMESELFGHTKGSFTGASEAKKGLIELANGGTAFFDEIGDLPLELQVKLLRLLQEREYRAVGSLQRQKVDIRVLAATHRDLSREVTRGAFRQDLFYRLNVVTIRMPPLRERKGDIPLLVERFLAKTGAHYTITPEVMRHLMQHEWPGNVRELYNAVERLVAMASGPLLHTHDLPSSVRNSWEESREGYRFAAVAAGGNSTMSGDLPPVLPLHEVEKRAILEALKYTKGDRSVAAVMLQIGRTTLYRKLKEYGLESIEAA
jgi:DNA-binding NtrC family response regulator